MPLLERVRRLIDGPDVVIHECRHCGTTVDPGTECCEACGSGHIARYVIE